MIMQVTRLVVACVVLILVNAPRLHAQEPLVAARQLYASAEYEDALRLLDGLSVGSYSRDDRQALAVSRCACWRWAPRGCRTLDRGDDRAGSALPAHRRHLAAPLRSATPSASCRRSSAGWQAKMAFDRQDFVAAASGFKRVVDALKDPDITHAAMQPPLSDLRTLAAGFHDLSVKAIPPPPPPLPPSVEPPPVVNLLPKIYTGEEPDVVPPVAIRQEMPKFPGLVRAGGIKGMIEVIINEEGRVESGAMTVPIDPSYDRILLTAATKWAYRPATASGKPVKFLRRIQVNISKPNP
jgi:hypothetical protein